MKGSPWKLSSQNRCYRTGKYTVCRRTPCIVHPGNVAGWGSEGVNLSTRRERAGAYNDDSHMRDREEVVGNFGEKSRGNSR